MIHWGSLIVIHISHIFFCVSQMSIFFIILSSFKHIFFLLRCEFLFIFVVVNKCIELQIFFYQKIKMYGKASFNLTSNDESETRKKKEITVLRKNLMCVHNDEVAALHVNHFNAFGFGFFYFVRTNTLTHTHIHTRPHMK